MPSISEPISRTSAPKISSAASMDLDLVRGLAAILVVVGHVRGLFFEDFPQNGRASPFVKLLYFVTGFGHEAVIVFFVLSGYLVGGSVLRLMDRDKWSWTKYAVDRCSRLYTVLIPALLLGLLLDWSGQALFGVHGPYGGGGQYLALLRFPVADSLNFRAFLGNLIFLQPSRVPVFGSNGPLWSLANEFWYYLAFPLLWFTLLTTKPIPSRAISLVLGLAVLWFIGLYMSILFTIWLMGVVIAGRPLPSWLGDIKTRVITTFVWCLVLASTRFGMITHGLSPLSRRWNLPESLGPDVFLGIFTTVWVASLVAQPEGARSRMRASVSKGLSHISYTCYLVHFPALVWLAAMLLGNGARWRVSTGTLGMSCLILVVISVYVCIAWWLFERNTVAIRDRARAFVVRKRGLAAGT